MVREVLGVSSGFDRLNTAGNFVRDQVFSQPVLPETCVASVLDWCSRCSCCRQCMREKQLLQTLHTSTSDSDNNNNATSNDKLTLNS